MKADSRMEWQSNKESVVDAKCEGKGASLESEGRRELELDDARGGAGWRRFLGMILMAVGSVFFSLAVTQVKMLRLERYSVYNISLWRFIGGCVLPSVPTLLVCHFVKKQQTFQALFPLTRPHTLNNWLYLFLRALAGIASIVFRYEALVYLSVADTTAVAFSTPVLVTFLACALLGEKFGVMNIVAAFVTFLGVLIITRPPFLTGARELDKDVVIGVALALASMIFAAFIFLFLRKLKSVHFAVITFSFGVYGTLISLVLAVVVGGVQFPRSTNHWLIAAALCALTYGGQVCTTLAFKLEDAGPLSLVRSFDVIFSFVWQAIFLNELPDTFSILGSIVVVLGVLLIGCRKYLQSLPEHHAARRWFSFILA